jgi:integrase
MARKRKLWSRTIEEAGVAVTLFERASGGTIYRLVRTPGGGRDRKAMGHCDRALAEQQARLLARRIAELRYAGHAGTVTFGQLAALYERERLPMLTAGRQRNVRGMLRLLERHFGREYELDNLSQHEVDRYVRARQSGALKSPRHRTPHVGVSAGTVRNELHLLEAMTRWGQSFKVGGRRLLGADPMAGVAIPAEKNAKRPVANAARYEALCAVADAAEPTGRFRCVLALARHTGRRINAIVSLRRSDVLLTRDAMRRALAEYAMDLAHADAWPHGAIRWGAATDKLGFEAITPISRAMRDALDDYLRARPSVGDAPLIPGGEDATRSVKREIAYYWLRKAEKLAKLEHLERGGYHVWRRAWASERRHLPAQDVAAAAGWRSLSVMRSAYMQADAETVLSVVETEAAVPTSAPVKTQPAPSQRVTKS